MGRCFKFKNTHSIWKRWSILYESWRLLTREGLNKFAKASTFDRGAARKTDTKFVLFKLIFVKNMPRIISLIFIREQSRILRKTGLGRDNKLKLTKGTLRVRGDLQFSIHNSHNSHTTIEFQLVPFQNQHDFETIPRKNNRTIRGTDPQIRILKRISRNKHRKQIEKPDRN